jgi:hypothetical protein
MLALTDEGLAHLAIAATAIAPEQRERWLQKLARELDPPTIPTVVATQRARSPAAIRQHKVRQRRRAGVHIYRLPLRDVCVEGLIEMMLASGQLSAREADDHRMIEAKLARLLEAQGERWTR